MKPFGCINVTVNRKNEEVNGKNFSIYKVPSQTLEELEVKKEELAGTVKKAGLPKWLEIAKMVCYLGFMIVLIGVIKAAGKDVSFEQMLRNAPLLILGGIACAVVYFTLLIITKIKQKQVCEENNIEGQIESVKDEVGKVYESVGIPADAYDVDMLLFTYSLKNGEVVPKATGMSHSPYVNVEVRIYRNDGKLCLFDMDEIYGFELSELKAIRTYTKGVIVPFWNKDEDIGEEKYKLYKVRKNSNGDISFKGYHVLEIEHGGELWGLYFPSYELSVFEKLTGLKAENEDK